MKKSLLVILLLCLLCALASGCSSAQTEGDIVEQESLPESATVDVDLSVLSSTMVYAEVANIMTNPADYIGKTIKMSGSYYTSYYDVTGLYYHNVIIEDATSCCQQGLEFVWTGDHTYPDDYPEQQARIEVIGVFDSYEELGETYYYLVADDVTVL